MSNLILYRTAIAETLAADSRLSGVNIFTHGGNFDLLELKAYASKLPAVAISLTRVETSSVGGEAWGACTVALVVMSNDRVGIKRDVRSVQIVEALLNILRRHPNQRWGLTSFDIGQVTDAMADNLYSAKLDKEGVSFWGVVFHQSIHLSAVAVTNELETIAVKYDLYPRDNDAPIGTPTDPQPDDAVIDAEDIIDVG